MLFRGDPQKSRVLALLAGVVKEWNGQDVETVLANMKNVDDPVAYVQGVADQGLVGASQFLKAAFLGLAIALNSRELVASAQEEFPAIPINDGLSKACQALILLGGDDGENINVMCREEWLVAVSLANELIAKMD